MSEEKKTELPKSVIGFLDKYGEKLWNGVKGIYKSASDEARLNWRLGYETYLDTVLRKYTYAKPYFSPDMPWHMDALYIQRGVNCNEVTIPNISIEKFLGFSKFNGIVGPAGSGKSILAQHLLLDTIKSRSIHYVPVLLELRDLDRSSKSLIELIKSTLKALKFNFSDEYITLALDSGHFVFFLDCFDEVGSDKIENVLKEIQSLVDSYNQNCFFLLSRPNYSLYALPEFYIWNLLPLSRPEALQLVDQIPEATEIKEQFKTKLASSFFEENSFLSNPLLLSIMATSFGESPSLHISINYFYENAFQALFHKHDWIKGGFKRKRYSTLDISDFSEVLSCFSALTYNDGKLFFSHTDAINYLCLTQNLTGIEFDPEDFLDDALNVVNILKKENFRITYRHDSFQEYYCAKQLVNIRDQSSQQKILKKWFEDPRTHDLIFLAWETSSKLIEELIFKPFFDELESKISDSKENNYKVFLRLLFSDIFMSASSRPEIIFMLNNNYRLKIVRFLFENYSTILTRNYDFSPKEPIFLNKMCDILKSIDSVEISLYEILTNPSLFRDFARGSHVFSIEAFGDLLEFGAYLKTPTPFIVD